MSFAESILNWYAVNKRSLPWRQSRDPYKIWLSEIILQQTKVIQGTPYYLKFVAHFPTVYDLASATEEVVLKLWQGLGYYSRARNMHATSISIVNNYNGKFPETYKELLKLKGVGDYTASAISSICFNAPEPVVDGNVYRVLSRYFGVDTPINSTEGIKYFKTLAQTIMDVDNIRDYNQGLMEFGALQCTPKKPTCRQCILMDSCVALRDNIVGVLPIKINKTKIKKRYFNFIVPLIREGDAVKTIVRQRIGKGIWQNLYEFPLLETDKQIGLLELNNALPNVLQIQDVSQVYSFNEKVIVHKLSHQHLFTTFWIVTTTTAFDDAILLSDIEKYPVPVLIADFIKAFKKLYF